jgi:hypothetical protein
VTRLVTGALALLLVATTVSAAGPALAVVREVQVSATPTSSATRSREPIVAAHPTDPARIAVVYPTGDRSPSVVIRISRDAGRSWTSVPRPTGGGNHPVIAWGPGPTPGAPARLYYMAMTSVGGRCCYFAISSTANEGRTWSGPYLATSTPPWSGGFPELAVDANPASPNYGVVYAAYNWPASSTRGPGLRLLASADGGRTWRGLEVPKVPAPSGYPAAWRIDYRVQPAPDGSVFVAFYQRDLRSWSLSKPFSYGSLSNVGRIGFGVARAVFTRSTGSWTRGPSVLAAKLPVTSMNLGAGSSVTGLTDPMWQYGFDVDPVTGSAFLATAIGTGVRVYRSADLGRTWASVAMPAATPVAGRTQRLIRPDLVAGPGFVAVTLHTLDASGSYRTVGSAAALSVDGGRTFSRPAPVTRARWSLSAMAGFHNGVGLRERAVLLAGSRSVAWAWGDGRIASASRPGRSAIFAAVLRVDGLPAWPPPTASPPPSLTPSPPPATPAPTPSAEPSPEVSPLPSDSPPAMPTVEPSPDASTEAPTPDPSSPP